MEINMDNLVKLVDFLKENNLTISTMESCSGGAVASAISNVKGSSQVFKFSAITYNNDFKIKMGVNPKVLEKYGPYHIRTTKEMAKNAAKFATSNIGIGISGELKMNDYLDKENESNLVYLTIYLASKRQYFNKTIKVLTKNRVEAKNAIVNIVIDTLINIFNTDL